MKKILFILVFILTTCCLYANESTGYLDTVIAKINDLFKDLNILPQTVEVDQKSFNVEYTFDHELSNYIVNLVRKFKPTSSAIVVVDNETGNVLTAVGYDKKHDRIDYELPFSSSHPAASLAKIVTSAALLEQEVIDLETPLIFLGKTTTLRPYQLTETIYKSKKRRFRNRYQSFMQAFASSNNAIFGKAALKNLTGDLLQSMADRLGFNDNIMEDLTISDSEFGLADSPIKVAQYASGYNNSNTISPVHAATISSIIANNGLLKNPRVIKRIYSENIELIIPPLGEAQVFNSDVAENMKQLMEATIVTGTGRRSFFGMKSNLLERLDIGGKSGTFSGGVPYGKHDWFVAYAKPKNDSLGKGISIAVMNINSKRKIRSSKMVRNIIEHYFRDLPEKPEKESESSSWPSNLLNTKS